MYNGKINNANNIPPRFKPTVKAAPTAPSKLNTGVPNNSDNNKVGMCCVGRPNIKANKGDNITNAKPQYSQCASTLARTITTNGCGETTHCSSEPSSKSLRNNPSSDNNTANKAATQIKPGDKVCSSCVSGPTAKGNNAITMVKNTNGLTSSAGRRKTMRVSRNSINIKTLLTRW